MATHPRDPFDPHRQQAFQERFWKVQRAGWVLMGLLVLLALSGLLGGGGPLARGTTGGTGALRAEWDRFARIGTPTSLTATLPPGGSTLTLSRALMEGLQVERVVPQPGREEPSSDGGVVLHFEARPGAPSDVTLHLVPRRIGRLAGRLSTGPDGSEVPLSLFVYP